MEIPFNLDNLRRHLSDVTLARRVLPEDVAARQKLLEESVYDVAVERLKRQADLFAELGLGNNVLLSADLQRWMWEWHNKLKARLEKEIKNIAAAEQKLSKKHTSWHCPLSPYLALVKAERLSLITILEIMRLQGSGGVHDGMKTTRALVAIGKAVEIEYKAQMCRANKIQIPGPQRQGDTSFFTNFGYRSLQERRVAAAKHMMDGEGWTAVWTQGVRSKIGGILVECLMDVAEVTRTALDRNTGETMSVLLSFVVAGWIC
jgi:DNA-directed RNA polymerase